MTRQADAEGGKEPSRPGGAIPVLECDLVMKGGITSGIVYPSAVAAIAAIAAHTPP